MGNGADEAIYFEKYGNLNQALKDVLGVALESDQALFEFLEGTSRDVARSAVALVASFVRGADPRARFFQRQVSFYQGLLLRPSLLSLKRLSQEERVELGRQAVRLAAEDLGLLQGLEIDAIEVLAERILDRHLRLLESARELVQQPGARRMSVADVRVVADAVEGEWR